MIKYLFPYKSIKMNSEILIWGCGVVGRQYIDEIENNHYCRIKSIVDKEIKGEINGLKVIHPEEISKQYISVTVILAHSEKITRNNMRAFLNKKGFDDHLIINGGEESVCLENQEFSVKIYEPMISVVFLREIAIKRKIIVYGTGRRAADYTYLFGKPDYYVQEKNNQRCIVIDGSIKNIEELQKEDRNKCYIIIATDEYIPVASVKSLEEIGFQYGVNYCYIHQWGKMLDLPEKKGKIIGVCNSINASNQYKIFCSYYGQDYIDEVVNKFDDVTNDGYYVVFDDEAEVVRKVGMRNVLVWNIAIALPSMILRRCESSKIKNLPLCNKVFQYAEITADDKTNIFLHLCCAMYLHTANVGMLSENDFYDLWHSNMARVIRLSIINRTFVACSGDCPFIASKSFNLIEEDEWDTIKKDYLTTEDNYPRTISLNFDHSCNLYCVFCRKNRFMHNEGMRSVLDGIAEHLEQEVLSKEDVQEIRLAGDGEVFASHSYRKILFDDRNRGKNLQLITNGTLIKNEEMQSLIDIYKSIRISCSIGSYKKNVYEKYWRGGKWEKVKENIEYIGKLRKKGYIAYLRIYYLCTTDSFEDLPDFYKWAEVIGVDEIALMRLFPFGELVNDKYYELSLFDDTGELKSQYRDFFNQSLFKKSIWTGNVVQCREGMFFHQVDNN